MKNSSQCPKAELLKLINKHGLDKETLSVNLSKDNLARECSSRDIEFNDARDPVTGKLIITSTELLEILSKHGVTKEDLQNYHMQDTLKVLFRDECLRVIKAYPSKTLEVKEFMKACDKFENRFPDVEAWVKFGSLAITGQPKQAIERLKKACNRQGVDYEEVCGDSYEYIIDPDDSLELDNGTQLFEHISLRKPSEITGDQLYIWYTKECQYNGVRPQRVTEAELRNMYIKSKTTTNLKAA
ncbi:hypothetical protein ABC733_18925 [Mangrovibacter sp. SLW1]